MGFRLFFFILITFVLWIPQGHTCLKEVFGTSWINGPSLEETLREFKKLEMIYPLKFLWTIYGLSEEGRPLMAARLAHRGDFQNRSAVLITGLTHGNENTNIPWELIRFFLDDDSEIHRFLASGGMIYVIPIVNPDGYARNRRKNANGLDLNRDFPQTQTGHLGLQSREVSTLTHFIDQELIEHNASLKVSVDYHCCANALLYPWSHANVPLPALDKKRFLAITSLAQKTIDPWLRHGAPRTIVGYFAEGSSKDYYYTRYGTLAFTFEGLPFFEAWRIPQHAAFWIEVAKQLTSSR